MSEPGRHRCPKKDCDRRISDALFACYPHWQALPHAVKVEIGRTARQNLFSVNRRQAIDAARRAWGDL